MRDEELDAILSREQDIVPSSGFAASVMEAVARQAAAPPPIPFPWRRALPGFATLAVALFVILMSAIGFYTKAQAPASQIELSPALIAALELAKEIRASWLALALVISFVSIKLSYHLCTNTQHD